MQGADNSYGWARKFAFSRLFATAVAVQLVAFLTPAHHMAFTAILRLGQQPVSCNKMQIWSIVRI
jgi:hypothetical protein